MAGHAMPCVGLHQHITWGVLLLPEGLHYESYNLHNLIMRNLILVTNLHSNSNLTMCNLILVTNLGDNLLIIFEPEFVKPICDVRSGNWTTLSLDEAPEKCDGI